MNKGSRRQKRSGFWWILIVLVLGVLALTILAFASPVSQARQEITPSPSGTEHQAAGAPANGLSATQTAEAEALPPTPEEIGHTDGIILMSTILILILLLATLRETIWRRNR